MATEEKGGIARLKCSISGSQRVHFHTIIHNFFYLFICGRVYASTKHQVLSIRYPRKCTESTIGPSAQTRIQQRLQNADKDSKLGTEYAGQIQSLWYCSQHSLGLWLRVQPVTSHEPGLQQRVEFHILTRVLLFHCATLSKSYCWLSVLCFLRVLAPMCHLTFFTSNKLLATVLVWYFIVSMDKATTLHAQWR